MGKKVESELYAVQDGGRAKSITSGPRRLPRLSLVRPSVVLASLFINLLALTLPIVILQVYDRIIPNQASETLFLLVVALCTALVLDAALRIARSYLTGWAGMKYEHIAASRLVTTILRAEQSALDQAPPGEHLDRIAALEQLRDFYTSQGVIILVDLPFAAIFLGLIWAIAGDLVWVPLTTLALFVVVSLVVGLVLRKALRRRAESDDRRFSFIIELLGGIHTVKAMAMEEQMLRRYERLQEAAAETTYNASFVSGLAQGFGTLFSQLTMIAIVSVGSMVVLGGDLTIGGLAACTMLAGRTIQPLLRAMGIWTHFQNVKVAKERVAKVFAMPAERRGSAPRLPAIEGEIEFENVTFQYPGVAEPVFKDLNLTIAAGETVAIRGVNGCGKSTLLQLILGDIRPTAGKVTVDGYDTSEHDAQSLRDQIGYLPQYGVLFQGTIMDNLTMFRGDEQADEAVALSRMLGIDEFVARLPMGFATRVGDSSTDALPGGVRQRIAIARALVKRPPIILFDEANSMLDRGSDEKLLELLKSLRGKCTLVLVSYRPSVVKLADRVLEIKDSGLKPLGVPEQSTTKVSAAS